MSAAFDEKGLRQVNFSPRHDAVPPRTNPGALVGFGVQGRIGDVGANRPFGLRQRLLGFFVRQPQPVARLASQGVRLAPNAYVGGSLHLGQCGRVMH